MGKIFSKLKYIVPLALCLAFFQNCGVAQYGIDGDPPNSILGSEGEPIQALNCNDPSDYQMTRLQLNFSDPGQVCQWSQGENLAQKDAHIMAINRQVADISIPPKAIACAYSVEVPRQLFRYDDIFYLSINNVAIATNAHFSLESLGNNLLTLNWMDARGMPWSNQFNNSTSEDYCLGQAQGNSNCSWAATDTEGEIALSFNQSVFDGILRATGNVVELAVVGDNDATDCRHTGLTVNVEVYYVD